MTTTNTPILRNFQFLLHNFESSKVNSKEFQPNEERQRLLIIKGATHRILSLAFKKETTKYVYSQRTKLEEDKKRKNGEEGVISVDIDASNGQMTKPSKTPKSLDLTKKSSQSAFRDSMDVSSRTVAFANTLKVSNDSNQISSELSVMAFDQTKDSKKLFDFICRGYDLGKSYQLNPKKIFEDIDLSSFSSNVSLANVTKLEDLTQMKKKDGILLIFDPSTNTLGEEISIKLTYMKSIDLNTEEEVTKEYSFYSNGNYFGIKLIKDLSRGQQSPPYTNRDGFSSVQFDITKVSLPGWHTKFPIFVPAVKCRLELIGMEKFVKHASLVNNLTRLKFHASFSTGLKSGMRRIHEFLDRYILQEASNIILPGGLSALNYACLHGNYEAVQKLITSGGSINMRCKSDHHCSPLHEAVLGRNVDVVNYLLANGANQLLRDDSGNCPLHYACKLGDPTIARILMESPGGRRALVLLNNLEQKPIDVCSNHYLRSRVEGVMRKHRIFVAPRVSILERA